MPTPLANDTRQALGPNAEKCDSRSLLLERFADPAAREDGRKAVFTRVFSQKAATAKAIAWPGFLMNGLGLKADNLLFAQLQSRLMVNMAGGVMENAGLCLDRFGLPYIPGSAVKGCARRMAIQNLLEAREAREPSDKFAGLLADIALVFGWGEQDWKTREEVLKGVTPRRDKDDGKFEWRCQKVWEEKRSDFAYACGEDWPQARDEARKCLGSAVKDFAGSVSFLPAWPVKVSTDDLPAGSPPELGALELDVLTCHHRTYYSAEPDRQRQPDKWRDWQAHRSAPDTEEPNPVVFPAIAAGHVFVFAMLPLRDCSGELLDQARRWLSGGLGTFGLGAKTAAGYGWFETGEEVQAAVRAGLARASQKPNENLTKELRTWTDKQVRKGAAAFMFQDVKNWPKTGREAMDDYQFTLATFILAEKVKLFLAEKNHQGSEFAKGVKRLAEKFKLPLP